MKKVEASQKLKLNPNLPIQATRDPGDTKWVKMRCFHNISMPYTIRSGFEIDLNIIETNNSSEMTHQRLSPIILEHQKDFSLYRDILYH